MDIIDRILEVQQEEHPNSQRAFELSIGKTSGYLNMTKKRKGSPAANVILKVIDVYSKYSLNWLMTGKGDKYINNTNNSHLNESTSVYEKKTANKDILNKLDDIDKKLEYLLIFNKIDAEVLDAIIESKMKLKEKSDPS